MTERPHFSDSRRRPVLIAVALSIVLVAVLLAAGCVGQPDLNNQTGTITQTPVIQTTQKSTALYKTTIAQPDGSHAEFIKMDSDVYNQGEVVEFYLINSGSQQLRCGSVNPYYFVNYKIANGSWSYVTTESGPIQPSPSDLYPGESTPVSRLITNDWKPGLYRISFNCHYPVEVTNEGGKSTVEYQPVFHDFTLREKPGIRTDNEGVR